MIVSMLKDPRGLKWIYDRIIIFSGTFRTQYQNLWSKLSSKGITVYEELDEAVLMKVYEEQLGSGEHVLILSDDMDQQWAKLDQQVVNKIITNSRHCNLSLCFLVYGTDNHPLQRRLRHCLCNELPPRIRGNLQ